jgi:GTPase
MINDGNVVPVLTISNKNGYNINNLHRIIYNTPMRDKFLNQPSNGTIIYIDGRFTVTGIGLVVSGTIKESLTDDCYNFALSNPQKTDELIEKKTIELVGHCFNDIIKILNNPCMKNKQSLSISTSYNYS